MTPSPRSTVDVRAPGVRAWLGLAVFCLALVALHALWVQDNGWIRASDEAIHNLGALRIHRALLGEESLPEVLLPAAPGQLADGEDRSLYYPPLTYMVTAVSYFFLGDSHRAASGSLALFQVLLVVGLWLFVWRSAGPRAAWVAVLLGATSPPLLGYGRIYFLELPSTAWLVWAVLFLQDSHGFRRPTKVLGFTLCATAGLFTRWNFALFVAAPVLLVMPRPCGGVGVTPGWAGALVPWSAWRSCWRCRSVCR